MGDGTFEMLMLASTQQLFRHRAEPSRILYARFVQL
jgi:hypothetical protein